MIAAPVGTRLVEENLTVAPTCGDAAARYLVCVTHGGVFPDRAKLAAHTAKQRPIPGAPPCIVAELCHAHGLEASSCP